MLQGLRYSFRRWVAREALGIALAKPSPREIPLSDPQKVKQRNYCTVSVTFGEASSRHYLRYLTTRGARADWFSEHSENPECVLDWALADSDILIIRYLAEIEIRYNSAVEFIFHHHLQYAHFALLRERLAQAIFNRRKLRRQDRVSVLRAFVEATVRKPDLKMSYLSFMSEVYGIRWVRHGQVNELSAYYQLVLDSLVSSGDLNNNQGSYSLAAKGFATLADEEREDRRHRDNVSRQSILAVLTAVLAIIGLGQLALDVHGKVANSLGWQLPWGAYSPEPWVRPP